MSFADLDALTILLIAVAFFFGGAMKGILGIGLPLVAVPLLATAFDPPTAIALMAAPVFTANLWQVARSGLARAVWRRFWPAFAPLVVTTVVAAQFVTRIDPRTGTLILSAIVIAFCVSQLVPPRFAVTPRAERWLTPGLGGFAGLLGGVSNFFGPPLIAYLIALRLPKDTFVAAIGLLFLIGTTPLYASLAVSGTLNGPVLATSAAAALPNIAGVALGTRLRGRLSQQTFRRLLVAALLLIALNLIRRNLL